MDLLKKAKERTQQKLEETMGTASKTEYDPDFQLLMEKSDNIKVHTEKILAAIESYIQPDPSLKILPGFKHEGPTKSEKLGNEMASFGEAIKGDSTAHAYAAGKEAFNEIGQADRKLYETVAQQYIGPIKDFLSADCKNVEEERKKLNTNRLDMDTLKGKYAHKPNDATLKTKLDGAENEFKVQQEKVTEMIHAIEAQLPNIQKYLKSYIQAHLAFHQKAAEILTDLNGKF